MDKTRAVAKQMLASTWLFKQVDDTVALREVALIEAVQDYERTLMPLSPSYTGHDQPPRAV